MGQPGIGAMIGWLSGNEETVEAFTGAKGKTIASLELANDADQYRSCGDYEGVINRLQMRFTDGTGILFFDDGQSCCESRYMHTDDDLQSVVGGKLLTAECRDGGTKEGEYGDEKECQFLVIETDKGSVTVANYNEHNGYYGGFNVVVRALPEKGND